MVLVGAHVHPRGLNVRMQSKVFALRKSGPKDNKKMSWEKIALQVKNLEGEEPGWKVCRDAYNRLCTRTGHAKYKYGNCGRPKVLTKPLRKWLVSRLRQLRKVKECTSTTLQQALAKEKKVMVEVSTVRRALHLEGFRWLMRTKKPKYNKKEKEERLTFADEVLEFTAAELKAHMNLSLDGVVFTMPPQEEVARENYCHSDARRVWRLPSEHALTELHGYDRYKNQVPQARVIPLWGGLASGGYASVLWHEFRKTDAEEWSATVRSGELIAALRAVNNGKKNGPWTILCDNESFLRAKVCLPLYDRKNIKLWKLPARSPDLNPIEKMWGWARKRLTAMDLANLAAHRPVLKKPEYKARIKRLLASADAQRVAARFATNLHTVALRVKKAKGAAVRG